MLPMYGMMREGGNLSSDPVEAMGQLKSKRWAALIADESDNDNIGQQICR